MLLRSISTNPLLLVSETNTVPLSDVKLESFDAFIKVQFPVSFKATRRFQYPFPSQNPGIKNTFDVGDVKVALKDTFQYGLGYAFGVEKFIVIISNFPPEYIKSVACELIEADVRLKLPLPELFQAQIVAFCHCPGFKVVFTKVFALLLNQ